MVPVSCHDNVVVSVSAPVYDFFLFHICFLSVMYLSPWFGNGDPHQNRYFLKSEAYLWPPFFILFSFGALCTISRKTVNASNCIKQDASFWPHINDQLWRNIDIYIVIYYIILALYDIQYISFVQYTNILFIMEVWFFSLQPWLGRILSNKNSKIWLGKKIHSHGTING